MNLNSEELDAYLYQKYNENKNIEITEKGKNALLKGMKRPATKKQKRKK